VNYGVKRKKERSLYRKSEYCNGEAALLVVVRNERGYLTASDPDFRVRLTCNGIENPDN
jgi:hypothetical protein